MKRVVLKPDRARSLARRHPWVFSGAVQGVRGDPQPGETVAVVDTDGAFLARGAYSPQSQIAVRIWTWDEAEEVSPAFLAGRLRRAVRARGYAPGAGAGLRDACRLVNAESDGLPGLIVDQYAGYLVCQFLSAGAEHWKPAIVDALAAGDIWAGPGGYERSDVDVRAKEGLPPAAGPLYGAAPPELIEFAEHGLRFLADVRRGHKTGFYLDQRENRRAVRDLAAGRDTLNAFAYTGAFALAALRGGAAYVLNIESSGTALELARRQAELNDFPGHVCEQLEGDVFTELRRLRDARRTFDLVVLDPPKLAHSAAQVERAGRAYKDINLLALKLLRPGGLLATFSCSGAVSAALFQKIVQGAALDAGREAQIVGRLSQSPDHPVLLSFPEAEYLKGLIVRAA